MPARRIEVAAVAASGVCKKNPCKKNPLTSPVDKFRLPFSIILRRQKA